MYWLRLGCSGQTEPLSTVPCLVSRPGERRLPHGVTFAYKFPDAHAHTTMESSFCSPTLFQCQTNNVNGSSVAIKKAANFCFPWIVQMSSEYKTVIHISSRVEKPRQRTGSDPLAHSAATRLRRDSSPSSSKHVSLFACMHSLALAVV